MFIYRIIQFTISLNCTTYYNGQSWMCHHIICYCYQLFVVLSFIFSIVFFLVMLGTRLIIDEIVNNFLFWISFLKNCSTVNANMLCGTSAIFPCVNCVIMTGKHREIELNFIAISNAIFDPFVGQKGARKNGFKIKFWLDFF